MSEPDLTASLPAGTTLIAAERRRQIETEGWSVEHDREHGAALLSRAGHAYASGDGHWWPFDSGTSFKPKGPLRNLIRAGALYQAAADVAVDTDSWSFASREKCEGHRDECAKRIDALIAEVLAVIADA